MRKLCLRGFKTLQLLDYQQQYPPSVYAEQKEQFHS